MVTTTYTPYGSSTTTTSPVWVFPVSLFPVPLPLALAIREIELGRHEGRTGASRVLPSRREAPSPPGAGWTELVQRSQQLITHMRSETETAFIPLILGTYGAGSFVGLLLVWSLSSPSSQDTILLVYLFLLPFLLLLVPFFLAVRRWARGYQARLDRQVRTLSQLEQAFFVRFAGITAGA